MVGRTLWHGYSDNRSIPRKIALWAAEALGQGRKSSWEWLKASKVVSHMNIAPTLILLLRWWLLYVDVSYCIQGIGQPEYLALWLRKAPPGVKECLSNRGS